MSNSDAWPHDISAQPPVLGEFIEVMDFGPNPGKLRVHAYVPHTLRRGQGAGTALVVALHGCGQSAASFDYGSGWSTLADRHGFALLMPEQPYSNNPNACFTWYLASDTRRGQGESMSIRQMIEHMLETHDLDRSSVFIAGLSAGGAMTSVMLANYPEVFAGGAIIAGLPYGGARSIQDAMISMSQGRDWSAELWADHVLTASKHRGAWPKVSVWHGRDDEIVHPRNADEIVKQWTRVHGLSVEPHVEHDVGGHIRRLWRNPAGDDVIEAITIEGMGHGVALAPLDLATGCGRVSAYHFDVGLSSGSSITSFWGIAGA